MCCSNITGEVKLFAGTNLPCGWLHANWQEIEKSRYSDLYATIWDIYGVANLAGNFKLPDMRGKVAVGEWLLNWGTSSFNLWDTGGLEKVSLTEQEMPKHSHNLNAYKSQGDSNDPEGRLLSNTAAFDYEYKDADHDIQMRKDAIWKSGGGDAHENMQPYTVLNYIIKY